MTRGAACWALALACALASCTDANVLRTYFADGSPWSEVHYLAGRPYGRATTWHENGKKAREGNYVDGHKDGLWQVWNPDGQIVVEIVYERGRQQGESRGWYPNGARKHVGHYVDGLLSGAWTEYFDNGQISLTGHYHNGKRRGVWAGYARDGTFLGAAKYVKGRFAGKATAEDLEALERGSEASRENGGRAPGDG